MPNFTDDEIAVLKKHVSNVDKDIYVIYNLPPEVTAVLFAYVSRSPLSFRENLLKLIKRKDLDMGRLIDLFGSQGFDYTEAKEKARQFHEKWIIGYGHSSVAEHAIASVAIENVSILATKVIEDNRLASYTEKSTRYQIFDKTRYYRPKKIMNSSHGKLFEKTCNYFFDTYNEIISRMIDFMKQKYPKPKDMDEKFYESVSKARACDIVRYILPAATLTNLAMTANARTLEHTITKLLSHPLDEVRDIGELLKEEVSKIIPTLVKYADYNTYISGTNQAMEELTEKIVKFDRVVGNQPVTLVDYDPEAEDKLVTAILYRYSKYPFNQIRKLVKKMDQKSKEKIVDEFLNRMNEHDWPMRELEHIYYTFDIMIDYGAFRDIQRHRICTQTNQDLTVEHGYDIPQEIIDLGFKKKFDDCMKMAKEAFNEISKEFPKEAQYVVPLAFKKRTLFTWNLRELHHFIKLRSGKEGHISYRRIAQKVFDELEKVHPLLARYIRVDKSIGTSR
ncbi:MAG: FAD-dependent thymidylate synthase [Candidatus Aenigmarchaeota archaeon]|nr:FAD-dependent thymidylate synthase [Candidatus Aenigmarchaeota archaeon]